MIKKQGLEGWEDWGAVGGKERGAGEKRKKVAKGIKMKIIHLSRSVWQPEAPFDNVMHTIIHAQCGGHWETLVGEEKKNICCYVSPIGGIKKRGEKRGRIQINAIRANVSWCLASVPLEKRLLSFTASSPLSASSN